MQNLLKLAMVVCVFNIVFLLVKPEENKRVNPVVFKNKYGKIIEFKDRPLFKFIPECSKGGEVSRIIDTNRESFYLKYEQYISGNQKDSICKLVQDVYNIRRDLNYELDIVSMYYSIYQKKYIFSAHIGGNGEWVARKYKTTNDILKLVRDSISLSLPYQPVYIKK